MLGLLSVVALALLSCGVSCGGGEPTARPNILLFISDDHGFAGHEFVKRPSVDRLADEGIVFTRGYAAASTCLPSLRTLLGGVPPQAWERSVAGQIQGGLTSDALVGFEDVYVTMLDDAGVAPHACAEGRSFRGLASGEQDAWTRTDVFRQVDWLRPPKEHVWAPRRERGLFLRSGKWAYSNFVERGRERLFDLSANPLGRDEVGDEHAATLAELRERAKRHAERLEAQRCPLSVATLRAPS